MAFQIQPNRAHDTSALISSEFREFFPSTLFLLQRMRSNGQASNS